MSLQEMVGQTRKDNSLVRHVPGEAYYQKMLTFVGTTRTKKRGQSPRSSQDN